MVTTSVDRFVATIARSTFATVGCHANLECIVQLYSILSVEWKYLVGALDNSCFVVVKGHFPLACAQSRRELSGG